MLDANVRTVYAINYIAVRPSGLHISIVMSWLVDQRQRHVAPPPNSMGWTPREEDGVVTTATAVTSADFLKYR